LNRKIISNAVVFALFSTVSTLGCSSSGAPAPPTLEAGLSGTDLDSSTNMPDVVSTGSSDVTSEPTSDATSVATSDAASEQADVAACAPCPSQYSCVIAPSGLTATYSDTQAPDGTCHVSGMTLYCGGTGLAANGMPLTWAAGNNLGPSGGPGIVIQAGGLQFNCE
jgi:hypothetical protein